ncbi:efflux RND transporter periplasmic adaptor subunit [Larkinella punicea]|uniref:Efflux RND transporter periplasmic adaptor subunit n=1 Tax=Larkinella punicea TaxID=2315727 RepID=A0A368JIV9_9BACT|nr:efflux RND transporter periplasmic adaptor subunit [Larkinella punicea]RCR67472.1 efflux RND transporter periplasmic adaptor subunit [Larkinella punicea]
MIKHSYFFLALLSGLTACNEAPQQKKDTPATVDSKPDTVHTLVLKTSTIAKQVTLPGELFPDQRVQIYAKLPGFVRRVAVDIGSVVRQGQVLAILDAPEQQARLTEARSRWEAAKSKLGTSRDAYERLRRAANTPGVVSASELERGRNQMRADSADVQVAHYSVQALQDMADYLVLRAPFGGVVTRCNVDPGAYVGNPTDKPVLEMENNRTLRLRVAVPEALTGSHLTGNKVRFSTRAVPNQQYDAVLVRKTDRIDVDTRSEIWEFSVDNGDHQLKSGMYTDVVLDLGRTKPSFAVPFSAVVTTLERKFVIRIKGGQTQWVDVRPGLTLPDKVEIFGALNESDTLVLKGNEELKPDSKVVARVDKP